MLLNPPVCNNSIFASVPLIGLVLFIYSFNVCSLSQKLAINIMPMKNVSFKMLNFGLYIADKIPSKT